MSTTTTEIPTTIIVGPVRLSYMNVFKPRKNKIKDGEPLEYSCVLLIPKQPTEQCTNPKEILKQIVSAINEAKRQKLGDLKTFKNPLKDGDSELNDAGEPKNPGFYFLNSTAKDEYPPVLIGGDKKPVAGGWESGDWGRVKVTFYGFDQKVNKGVGCGLRAIQFLYKDEPLGASSDPESVANEFGEVVGAHVNDTGAQVDEYDPFSDV